MSGASHHLCVKVCGVRDAATLGWCIDHGVNFAGFVFHSVSPRCVTKSGVKKIFRSINNWKNTGSVAVCVDPSDDDIVMFNNLGFDYIQLHGEESPSRVSYIKKLTRAKIIKAIPVHSANDLKIIDAYNDVDLFIFDAPTGNTDMPGGLGVSFDWNVLSTSVFKSNWMLSGGLSCDNVVRARKMFENTSHFMGVDVSSGVESVKGQKDISKMDAFIQAFRSGE